MWLPQPVRVVIYIFAASINAAALVRDVPYRTFSAGLAVLFSLLAIWAMISEE